MIGAPKCSRCPLKHIAGEICPCSKNKGKIIDGNYYWPVKAFRGLVGTSSDNTGIGGTPAEVVLPTDVCELLRWTTVRCKPSVDLTVGWTLYSKCPPLPLNSRWRREQKRPRPNFELSRDERRSTRDSALARTDEAVIVDPEILKKVKEALKKEYSEVYEHCTPHLRRTTTDTIYVTLLGQAAHWCTIKGDYHSSNKVYFNIKIDAPSIHHQTKTPSIWIYSGCFCKKTSGKCYDAKFRGKRKAWPTPDDAELLFPGFKNSAGSSSRVNGLAKQQRR